MNYGLVFRTVKHLKPTQVIYQVKYHLIKPAYVQLEAPSSVKGKLATEPILKFKSVEGNTFTFLNLEHEFVGWNFTDNGMLWAYNQNYFDWINQESASTSSATEGCKWIDKFIAELPQNKVGLDPYPIALRSINWVKFFCKYPEAATKIRMDSLYSQIKQLEKKLEYHLLGNHVLEDAYALYIAGSYFNDKALLKKAKKLLLEQLEEQVLPDGAHYEQSPMYHCILLDRLLDCININSCSALERYADKMLGHLESVKWNDGSIPLLNDSANGIAPTTSQIFAYAKRLGLKWEKIPLKECGYRKLASDGLEAIVDVGNITATYQPGHTHADSLNYELKIDGEPVVVDCGISTYNKTERRQYERSTAAHNCVVVDGKNSSEVWGGFRVGSRCCTELTEETDNFVEASHNEFGNACKRRFKLNENGFTIVDSYDGDAVSYIHLVDTFDMKRLSIEGAKNVEIENGQYSTEYNQFHNSKVVKILFNGKLSYTIK